MVENLRMKREWLILDVLYLIGVTGYLAAQLLKNGHVVDILFIMLLSFATLFVNYRQKKLYEALVLESDGEAFFRELYEGVRQKEQIRRMFSNRQSDIFSVVFATLFGCVMWQFHIWEEDLVIKTVFTIFLFITNIPTGLAIFRLFWYFWYSVQWLHSIRFDIGVNNCFAIRFIKRMRSNVLFTAVTYCTLSLSSILFTDIEINFIVILYTCFAGILVLATLLITDFLLATRVKSNLDDTVDRIDDAIGHRINTLIECAGEDVQGYESFQRLTDIKSYMLQQKNTKIDLNKLMSNIGLLFITVIPIILQWVLESLKL